LRTRNDETPQWEFCEGFMAALICCRRAIPASEYLPVLLGTDEGTGDGAAAQDGSFADARQQRRFMQLWLQRWQEVAGALAADVESLDDERAYQPEVMDVRGAVASLGPAEQAAMEEQELPSFGQVWALGFMFAVESWPEEWVAPRDKKLAARLDESLQAMVAMTEDDTGPPALCIFSEDGPPTVSEARVDAFGDALWSVYDLFDLWRSIGPRVESVRNAAMPGRNEPCWCGSGKKYKKCHGAG
ncbi:MAG: zinc chelation protein SecC, partial [Burkholderiaceae bacterium]